MFWYNYPFFIASKYLLKFNTFFLISVLTSDMRMYVTESNCKFTYLASRFPSINNFAPVFSNLSLTSRGKIIIWSGPMRSVMSDNSRAVAARTIAFWWLKNRNHNIEISFVARKNVSQSQGNCGLTWLLEVRWYRWFYEAEDTAPSDRALSYCPIEEIDSYQLFCVAMVQLCRPDPQIKT